MAKTVAIVGRPNVGKSTIFNRMVGARQSIVDDISGVTRDRQYGSTIWNGQEFNLIDTGGFVSHSEDVFEVAIREQVEIAMEESDVIVFVVDVTTGITDLDAEFANILRRRDKQVIVVVNKVDNHTRMLDANEFYSLGFENMQFISAISGSGTGELLDQVIELLDKIEGKDEDPIAEDVPKVAIIGQPNVGKSSLLNALLGQQRNIVTDIAGTTRDSIHTYYKYYQKEFVLIDTAGIRKKSKVHENLEFYSVIRAIKAIDESDICLLMIDATLGVEGQDLKILKVIQRKKKGLIILVNKWDLVMNKETNTAKNFEDQIKERIAPFTDVPIIFISALEKQRIFKAVETILEVSENRQRRISTSQLNDVMLKEIEKYPPPAHRGNYIKIKYVTQLPTKVPSFAFFCNHPNHIREPYKNYLENRLRANFNFTGVPVNIFFRQK